MSAPADLEDAAQLVAVVAENIRTLRARRGISLSELAQRAGLGKSTLSLLESAKGNPSVETLWAIAAALGVPFGSLIERRRPDVRVVPAGDGVRIDHAEPGHVSWLLASSPRRGTHELYEVAAEPGPPRRAAPHTRGTLETVYVLSGRLRLGPEDSPVELGPGDLAAFPGDSLHGYEALAPGTRFLVVLDYE